MWILAPTCYLLPSSVSGESDRLPHPSPTTWRLTLAYGGRRCQPAARHRVHVEGKAPRRATQMGRSRVRPLASSLHWLISTRSRYSQQEPGWKRQFIHEKCNIEAILGGSRPHEFTLHKHTHSGAEDREARWNFKKKSNKNNEASPSSKNAQVPEKRRLDERLCGVWGERHESETHLVGGENTVGRKHQFVNAVRRSWQSRWLHWAGW